VYNKTGDAIGKFVPIKSGANRIVMPIMVASIQLGKNRSVDRLAALEREGV